MKVRILSEAGYRDHKIIHKFKFQPDKFREDELTLLYQKVNLIKALSVGIASPP